MTNERILPRIMVIDDSQTIRVDAVKYLAADYECLGCEDGLDAISKIADFDPDLILVDIVMPRLNGYEALSIIRLNPRFERTPIFMMSSKGGVFDIAQGRILGFSGHITKPFKGFELKQLVGQALAAAQHRDSAVGAM